MEEMKKGEFMKDESQTTLAGVDGSRVGTVNGMQVEKAQGLAELQASTTLKKDTGKNDTKEKEEYFTKEDLDKLLEPYPLDQGWEVMEVIYLGIPAKDYMKQLQEHSSQNSFARFFIERGEQKVTHTDWAPPEPAEEYDGKSVIQACQLFAEIQIKDNPFVKVSPTTKVQRLIESTDTKVVVKSMAKVKDVPLCDTFNVEEELIIISPSPTANCAVLRISLQIKWVKNTLFKWKISSSTTKAGHQTCTEYQEWLKKRNLIFKEKKPPQGTGPKLKHGIEKSNKLFEKNVGITG